MLDIKFIRKNPDKIKEGCNKKHVKIDIDKLLKLDEEKRERLKKIENLRSEQKKLGKDEIAKAKDIKEEIKKLEPQLKEIDSEINQLMVLIPNPPLDWVPEGKDESDNVVLKEVLKRTEFGFQPKDYLTLAKEHDLIDVERASKISGSRFGILKNEAALLEFAILNYSFEKLVKDHKFIPIVPQTMIKPEMMQAMGYMERGKDEIYFLEKDNMFLVGTSEQITGPMHAAEVFSGNELPKRYVAFSSCFRREAGSYGKDTKGILRVHQFDKIEMFVFCKPEDSDKEHKFLLALQEELMKGLAIPYRVVNICAGDLGDPAAAKYDIESWIPSENRYRETHSTSNCTDFQARRLNIRYRDKKGELSFVHTLNGTAFAIGRILIALIENNQQKDGSIAIPAALRKYTSFKKIA